MPFSFSTQRNFRGFSLIEVAIVLLIVGVMFFGVVGFTAGAIKSGRYSETRRNLDLVEKSIESYVSLNKRLPCPADGTLSTGLEVRDGAGSCGTEINGVVPWATLGLAHDTTLDGWTNQFSFRVATSQATDLALDFTGCDPAGGAAATGTAPTQACVAGCNASAIATSCTPQSSVVVNRGLQMRDLAGNVIANPASSTGAAYVLISHGENGVGAFSQAGALQAGTSGTIESTVNANGLTLGAYYVADSYTDTSATAHFDDIVRYRSIANLASSAGVDQRKHF